MTRASDSEPIGQATSVSRAVDWREAGAATLFYIIVSIGLLSPMASNQVVPAAPDHANHIALILQARLAMDEGQLPIRVAPWEHDRQRYPVFQFYSPLPYTIAASVVRWGARANPLLAYKVVIGAALATAGLFVYLTGWLLARDRRAALIGGLLYMSAPYVLINVHARGAFTEVSAQGVLPIVIYCSLRAYLGPWRTPWIYAAGTAWAALALTHNITYVYSAAYVALWLAIVAIGRRGIAAGLWRVGVSFAIGGALAMFFLAPVITAEYVEIRGAFTSVQDLAWMTPLAALLSPVSLPPELQPGPHPNGTEFVHPAIGWPALIGVGLFVAGWRQLPRWAHDLEVRRVGAALLVVCMLAFVMTWSPFDFWRWLPDASRMVQFSYRLLTHVAWTAALLTVLALAFGAPARLDTRQTAAAILMVLIAHGSYLPRLKGADSVTVLSLLASPRIGYGDQGYLVRADAHLPGEIAERRVELAVTDAARHLTAEAQVALPRAALLTLGDLRLELDGHTERAGTPGLAAPARSLLVSVDDRAFEPLSFDQDGAQFILSLGERLRASSAPMVRLRFALAPARDDAPADVPAAGEPPVSLRLDRAAVVGFPVDAPVTPVRAVRQWCGLDGDTVECRLPAGQAAGIAALPVLAYPGMVDVTIDGRSAPTLVLRSLSHALVGVRHGAGAHIVRARFRGLPWANLVSLLAVALVAAGALLAVALTRRAHASQRALDESVPMHAG